MADIDQTSAAANLVTPLADASAMAEEITRKLSRASAAMALPATACSAGLFALIAIGHGLTFTGQIRAILCAVALTTASIAAALAYARALHARRRADGLIAALALLILLNSAVHLWLVPEADYSTNFAVLTFGLGLLVTRREFFYPLLALTLATWVTVVLARDVADAQHWAWNLVFFAGVAVVPQEQPRRAAVHGGRGADQ